MISVYSYDKACNILDLFAQNQIIALRIYLNTSLGEDNAKYVFDFKTYEDYPEEERIAIRSEFNEKNLQLVNQTVSALNEFISMMEIDNVDFFDLSFNILKKEFNYSKSYKKPLKEVVEPSINESYQEFITKFEKFVTQNGIHKMNVPELFEKKAGTGKQRGVKYCPINFGQLICKLKDVLIDNGDN